MKSEKEQKKSDFKRITEALLYLEAHATHQPSLEAVAAHVGLSPTHFQKLFTRWAGTSPKKFLQYINTERAKKLLRDGVSVLETSVQTGLSSPGRLHDLFVKIEGMTPGEYKNGGANLTLNYTFAETPFGEILVASTAKGVAYLAFVESPESALARLTQIFPNAVFVRKSDVHQKAALSIFNKNWDTPQDIQLHIRGTAFQLKVWETLLKIPAGNLASYNMVARKIEKPDANRAVGTAVGQNPVAYIIPCHRIIRATGAFGKYHWGSDRKKALIGWEAARREEC